jgi:hypothetical protein
MTSVVVAVTMIKPVAVGCAFEIMACVMPLAAAHVMPAMHLIVPELLVRVFSVMNFLGAPAQ